MEHDDEHMSYISNHSKKNKHPKHKYDVVYI